MKIFGFFVDLYFIMIIFYLRYTFRNTTEVLRQTVQFQGYVIVLAQFGKQYPAVHIILVVWNGRTGFMRGLSLARYSLVDSRAAT